MINKFTLSRTQNVRYVKEHLETLIQNNLALSRYAPDDPLRAVAKQNFEEAYSFILNNPDVENDYKCLMYLHEVLMKNLNSDVKSELNEQQIEELSMMINQPTRANLEIAIDVLLYILDKRLFADGDVRAALLFANKFMIDNGCGILTVSQDKKDIFREKLKKYKEDKDYDIKNWVYMYCVKGPKLDY